VSITSRRKRRRGSAGFDPDPFLLGAGDRPSLAACWSGRGTAQRAGLRDRTRFYAESFFNGPSLALTLRPRHRSRRHNTDAYQNQSSTFGEHHVSPCSLLADACALRVAQLSPLEAVVSIHNRSHPSALDPQDRLLVNVWALPVPPRSTARTLIAHLDVRPTAMHAEGLGAG
jgi:hypothetical protein